MIRALRPGVVLMVLGAMLTVLGAQCGHSEEVAPQFGWAKTLLEQGQGRGALAVRQIEAVRGGVEAIVALRYPGVNNGDKPGLGKVYLPDALRDQPDLQVPLVHVAGYEMDRGGAEGMLGNRVIVSTPHGEEPNPLSRGENLDLAILHRVRALSCVDDHRVTVLGGSAGGYMTLMVAAETFPLLCAMPDVPPVNAGYNCGFIIKAKPLAEAQPPGQDHPNMPVTLAVYPIAEGAVQVLEPDWSTRAWLNASPIVRLQEITCPTVITASTADMLVPMNQFDPAHVKPMDPALFPAGFTMDMDQVLTDPAVRQVLSETLPAEDLDTFVVPCPEGAPKLGWDGQPEHTNVPTVEVPFSRTKRFSLVILDEGAPEPQVGHFKHLVNMAKGQFIAWTLSRPVGPEQLNAAKLRRLMMRLQYRDLYPQEVTRNGRKVMVHRLDFPEIERADVLRSLRTYTQGPGCREHLQALYRELPAELKALGADFGEADQHGADTALEGR